MIKLKFTNAVKLGTNGLLQKVPGSKYWIVKTPFVWYLNYNYKGHKYVYDEDVEGYILNKIEVPVGEKTDMGSIPRIFWIFFDKTRYVSFLLHDHIYKKKLYNRLVCDKILYKALRVEGASVIEASLIYLGVRIGGWVGYNYLKN